MILSAFRVTYSPTGASMSKPQQIGRRRFLTRVQAAAIAVTPVVSALSASLVSGASQTAEAAPHGSGSATLEKDALAQAAAADRDLKRGRYHGPLHRIPWGAKDLFATKGIKTTWGAKPFENQVLNLDATVVERLRDAGAVLLAKLSMGSLAQGGVWFGGTTRNPWKPDTGSSGSSAGPAAATAAGLVGFALGTETRGSIITPS